MYYDNPYYFKEAKGFNLAFDGNREGEAIKVGPLGLREINLEGKVSFWINFKKN